MNTHQSEIHYSVPVYMPDGTPAPYVMTAEEAVKFLRLDTNGSKHPDTTLQYYIDEQMLVPVTIGKCRKYPLPALLRFIDRLLQEKENTS
jgi:hypothetical protein